MCTVCITHQPDKKENTHCKKKNSYERYKANKEMENKDEEEKQQKEMCIKVILVMYGDYIQVI